MIMGLFGKNHRRDAAHGIYVALVEQARAPVFYQQLEVADTLDGRFDMILLHAFFVFLRLKDETGEGRRLSQDVFRVMFDDMDQSLREMGVGDLSVGKRVKDMAKAFYGRMNAYEVALTEGEAALKDALARNLYRSQRPDDAVLVAMARYVVRQANGVIAQPISHIRAGRLSFCPPPEIGDR
jgi:cytochrome b pre-mRNA-processing protein 3